MILTGLGIHPLLMISRMSLSPAEQAEVLLNHYSFDLEGKTSSQIIINWSEIYDVNWLHLAVIEALYLGRYKSISVQQILELWKRRNQPIYHFNSEFERLICNKLPHAFKDYKIVENSIQEIKGKENPPVNEIPAPEKPVIESLPVSEITPTLTLHYSDFCAKLQAIIENSQTDE
ncbi:MAG: hypothetical protein P5702_21615 [Limnospira sp. PMC 1291.21]|nr:hypothetical protein [Limnospira sp. PMC 1249.20]MDT9307871.1 hypothetical protein [Limnospira sp. PMC 1291.21]MDT9318176.1 hypothetical protein [Limnospira sp. PMC 1306.21]MDT9323206.1 hypothetical protein [Limnospira sp. PMC 1290.21]